MHLGIDLRFYSSSPYGLSVYIKNAMKEVLPSLIKSSNTISTITLFLPHKYREFEHAVRDDLGIAEVPKSSVLFVWSKATYYSIAEQTSFLFSLYAKQIDLMYFFTPNIPILYFKPFVYQIMDATLLAHRGVLNPKRMAFKLCLYNGLKRAQQTLFLSNDARKNIQSYFPSIVSQEYIDTKTDILHAGIADLYTLKKHSNKEKAEMIGLEFNQKSAGNAQRLLNKMGITKPYFHFISVLRSYKNIKNLVRAFEEVNTKGLYQLVIAGGEDPKFPDIGEFVRGSSEYKKGNILLPGRVSDGEALAIIEHSSGLVAPSKAEGFGLWLLESAARGTGIIASDIAVFKEVLKEKDALFFDPYDYHDIARVWKEYIQLDDEAFRHMIHSAYSQSQTFTWQKTASVIRQAIDKSISQQPYESK